VSPRDRTEGTGRRTRGLDSVLDPLASVYGEPEPPPSRPLLDWVLLENVAYLVDDTRREQAFAALQRGVGTRPEQLLAVADETLQAVAGRGILPENQARKLREIAQITLDEFNGDLESVRALGLREAKRALMRFPSLGEPGA